jgi:hypothetical protein
MANPSTRDLIQIGALYDQVLKNTQEFDSIMREKKYDGSSSKERKCEMLLQRLAYIYDGLSRMNSREALDSPYRKIDIAYMKKELNDIQHHLERLTAVNAASSPSNTIH